MTSQLLDSYKYYYATGGYQGGTYPGVHGQILISKTKIAEIQYIINTVDSASSSGYTIYAR